MEERRLKRILSHLSTACDSFTGRIPSRENGEQVATEKRNLPITSLNDLHLSAGRSGATQFCSARNAMVVRGLRDRQTWRRLCGSEKDSDCGFTETGNHERQLFNHCLIREGSNASHCCLQAERPSTSEKVTVKISQPSVSKLSINLQPPTSTELVLELCKGKISIDGTLRRSTSENSNGNWFRRGPISDETCASKVLKGSNRDPMQEDNITKERHRELDLQPKIELREVSRDKRSVEALEAGKSDSLNLSKERMLEVSGAVLDDLCDLKGNRGKSKHQLQAREDSSSRKSSGLNFAEVEETHLKRRVERREEILAKNLESDIKPLRTKHGDTMNGGPISGSRTVDDSGTQSVSGSSSISTDMQSSRLRNGALVGMQVSRNYAMTGQNISLLEACVFCLIVQGRSPAFKLYEDEMCVCILDVHPLSHGHSLVIPKAHFQSLECTPPQVAAALCAVVPFISSAIMDATNCDSFNLLVNSGTAAGQVIFHTHFHIIPRRLGDNLWRSESACRRPLPTDQETAGLVQRIRHGLAAFPKSNS